MIYELIFKEEANNEVFEGYCWYEKQQPGLGESFLEEIEKYLKIIAKNPHLYAIRHNNKRAAILRRFPYLIAYEQTEKQIVVYAVFNTSQNPRKLRTEGLE
jgi:plasmid stabilization system protein ParE